jgi:formate hydrogenlyase subunit 3/multisubunit Na+/H+ antiporter MnhD subunit
VSIGFGLTVGSIAATLIFIAIGMLLFIPGFLIVKNEQKKPAGQQSAGLKALGYILMIIGCLVALGLGFGMLLGMLGDEL